LQLSHRLHIIKKSKTADGGPVCAGCVKKERADMDELMAILEDFRPDIDFVSEDQLIDDKILDSFDVVTLVGEIREAFDIEIGVNELVPENFNSAELIMAMIVRLQDE
jgi:acyl carrier protein